MNKQKLKIGAFITIFLFFLIGCNVVLNAQTAYNLEKISVFSPSYISDSDANPYQLQAIKYNKMWFFILNTKDVLEVITIEGDSLKKTSDFFQAGVFKVIERYGMSCKTQSKRVLDLNLSPYYVFDRKAEKDFGRILFLEYGYENKSFFRKTINVLIYPLTFFIKKKSPYEKELKKMKKVQGDINKKQKAFKELTAPML